MSDSIISLRAKRFHEHPLILQALAAVEAREGLRQIRASQQVSSRVLFPEMVVSIDQKKFFQTEEERAEEAYLSAMRFLETTREEILSDLLFSLRSLAAALFAYKSPPCFCIPLRELFQLSRVVLPNAREEGMADCPCLSGCPFYNDNMKGWTG
jgi:hypothetical protein